MGMENKGVEDWVEILDRPLPVTEAIASVADPAAGGVAVFLGTTRGESSDQGKALVALDYEAYQEMALPQMRTLAVAARSQWPVVRVTLLHRIGRVALAEPSVLIAVSTPHRSEAFEAWRAEVEHSRRIEREAESLDVIGYQASWGEDVSLRLVMLHLIHEYARHNGHADFLREGVDGTVGA